MEMVNYGIKKSLSGVRVKGMGKNKRLLFLQEAG